MVLGHVVVVVVVVGEGIAGPLSVIRRRASVGSK